MSGAHPASTLGTRRWRRQRWLRNGLAAWAILTLVGSMAITRWFSMETAQAPAPEELAVLLAALRDAAEGRVPGDLGEAGKTALPGPVRVVLWHSGLPVFRREFEAPTLADLAGQAARALGETRAAGRFAKIDLRHARFHLSFVVGEGAILQWPMLAASASFVATLDGVALRLADRTERLYPDDLLRARMYSASLPLPGGRITAGLDVPRAVESLWLRAHLPEEAWWEQRVRIRRFRTAEFVERPGRTPERLVAGRTMQPLPQTADDYRVAALDGVRWLERMLQPNGRFQYDYDPLGDALFDYGYSLIRHSGAAYFLASAHRKTGDQGARRAAARALDYIVEREMRACGGAPGRCVGHGRVVDTASAAMTAVAMAEYERGTQEGKYVERLRELTEFLLWLQKPNGDFVHLYDVSQDKRLADRLMFFSGQAALALIQAYRVLGDPTLLDRVRAALDYLTTEGWSFFGSAYFYGEEQWTCIAAFEAFPEVQSEAYLDFCERFAAFLRQTQTRDGQPPFGYEGAYVVAPLVAPRTVVVAGRTEAAIATYKLGEAMGRPDPVVLEQVRRSLSFLVRMRYGPEASPLFARPERAVGGMPGGFDDPVVRIDYVHHAGNALLGGIDILRGTD